MQLQPGREDVHPEHPQDILLGALTTCAEALEQLTEASLALPADAPALVRHRLRGAVGKSSESFRFAVSAFHAWTQPEVASGSMRSEYDFADGIRGAVWPREDSGDASEPVTATRDLDEADEATPESEEP